MFSQGDSNYDGSVNLDDFTILASQFGKTLAAPADLPRVANSSFPAAAPRAYDNAFSTTRILEDVLSP